MAISEPSPQSPPTGGATPSTPKVRSLARRLGWTATLASAGLALVALVGSFWPAELACHFRVQYAWLAGAGLIAAAVGRAPWLGAAAALSLTWQLVGIVPLYLAPSGAPGGHAVSGPALRIMALNVNAANRLHARAVSAIRQESPDVVFVLEVDERWMTALEALRDEYPHQYAEPREGNFGMAVFSRLPFRSTRTFDDGDDRFPFLEVTIEHQGEQWTLIGAHPLPPVRAAIYEARNRQLGVLAERAAIEGPVVVIGDLNITSWSPAFGRLLETANLRDSRQGYGVQATWPAPIPALGIAIDHALVSDEVEVVDRRVGPEIGSDHRPIVVDVRLARAPGAP